jgi:vacuole morphology and inheritance protein 14
MFFFFRRPQPAPTPAYERPNRLKGREESHIKWSELLDKFRSVQERARRRMQPQQQQQQQQQSLYPPQQQAYPQQLQQLQQRQDLTLAVAKSRG